MTLTLQEALNSLPTDPDEIAARLVQEGVTGETRSAYHCPLAMWLLRKVDGMPFIWANKIEVIKNGHAVDDAAFSVGLELFVHRFDSGKYPQLEACR